MVSSVHTYLKYVAAGKLYNLRHTDSFRAIETEAGSIGSTRVAPSFNQVQVDSLMRFIHDPSEESVGRMGMWLQCFGGGRPIDCARMRKNGIDWSVASKPALTDEVRGLIWRWAKNISKAGQAQYCPSTEEAMEVFGPPPLLQAEWNAIASVAFPLEKYTSSYVNGILRRLCAGAEPMPTSTSLRDLCHQILAARYSGDAARMVVHTPHRSTRAMQANYISNRPVSQSAKATYKKGRSPTLVRKWSRKQVQSPAKKPAKKSARKPKKKPAAKQKVKK